jgi:DnaK suppressor protein
MPESSSGGKLAPYQALAGEEYMGERQVAHFRALLLAWRSQLIDGLARTVHHLQDDALSLADPNDRASQEEEFALELSARERERKLIAKIDEALRQLEIGAYGFCETCGEPIGVRRLEARPTASLCVDCKEIEERRERQWA